MRIATLVSRLLLGLVFLAAGVSSFVIDLGGHAPPPMPGYAGDFQTLVFGSHFVLFTGAAQAVVGMLLALVTLAAILYNILAFHITMQPAMLVPVLVCIVLWVVVARAYAPNLRPLLEAKPPTSV
jgi:hypothetical protein